MILRHSIQESARSLVKRITDTVSAPIDFSIGDTVDIGISVGMTSSADDGIDSMATLLAKADQELYRAKRKRNDC